MSETTHHTHPLEPRVVHVWDVDGYDLYIGRTMPGKRYFINQGWGNPFKFALGRRDGSHRMSVIEQYRVFLLANTALLTRIDRGELDGKRLGCFCHPKPCHGDVLVEVWRERRLPVLLLAEEGGQ